MDWNHTDAKDRFGELVDLALTDGPQRVGRGKDAVIVISAAEYERLTGRRRSLKDYLLHGASLDGVHLARDETAGRGEKL